jgi:hypothetical protein
LRPASDRPDPAHRSHAHDTHAHDRRQQPARGDAASFGSQSLSARRSLRMGCRDTPLGSAAAQLAANATDVRRRAGAFATGDNAPHHSLRPVAMKFIAVRVRNAIVMHGYSADNAEIVEEGRDEEFVDKLIAVDRIQSVSEKYILVSSSHGRVMYWEYEGNLASVKQRLGDAGLLVA